MTDQRKSLSGIPNWNDCGRFYPLESSDTPRIRFVPVKNVISDFNELSYSVVITTTARYQEFSTQIRIFASIISSQVLDA